MLLQKVHIRRMSTHTRTSFLSPANAVVTITFSMCIYTKGYEPHLTYAFSKHITPPPIINNRFGKYCFIALILTIEQTAAVSRKGVPYNITKKSHQEVSVSPLEGVVNDID